MRFPEPKIPWYTQLFGISGMLFTGGLIVLVIGLAILLVFGVSVVAKIGFVITVCSALILIILRFIDSYYQNKNNRE